MWYYYPVGLTLALFCNFLWFKIARSTNVTAEIVTYGIYWDVIILFSFMAVPFLFYEVNLTKQQLFGIIITIAGIAITKLG